LPAALARGDEVDVVVRRGNLTVSSRGTLEASARVGEQVAVRIVATRVILRGRLSAATTVVIP
jgi:flagella basal body P-ring formation protein FlgA